MIGLLLAALAPGPAYAWTSEPCAPEDDSEADHARCARALYADREYVAAARRFERLWLDTGDAKYLYNAAAAREGAGHISWAQAQWTRYSVLLEISETERTEVQTRLALLRARLVPVSVTVSPADALGPAATFWCERGEGRLRESFDVPAALVADKARGTFTLHLEPGEWQLRVHPASSSLEHSGQDLTVTVATSPVAVEMPLVPEEPSEPQRAGDRPGRQDPELGRRLAIGLGAAGGLVLVPGIILLTVGASGTGTITAQNNTSTYHTLVDARESLRITGAGAGFTGAAAGLGAAAMLELLAPTRRRYQIQLGVGGGLAAVGLVLLAAVSFRDVLDENATLCLRYMHCLPHTFVGRERVNRGVSAALLGVGSSLMVGAGASYLVRVWSPRRRGHVGVGALLRPDTAGLVLHGKF